MKIGRDQVRLLPYGRELLSFKLIQGDTLVPSKDYVMLSCKQFTVVDDKEGIITYDAKHIAATPGTDENPEQLVSLLDCGVANIEPYGLCRPVIVATVSSPTSTTLYIVHVYSTEVRKFIRLNSFSLGNFSECNLPFCQIFDGPTLFLHFQDAIHLVRWDAKCSDFQVNKHEMKCPVPYNIKTVYKTSKGNFLVLTLIDEPSSLEGSMSDLLESEQDDSYPWHLFNLALKDLKKIEEEFKQLPHSYAAVANALLPIGPFEDARFSGGVIIATSLSQLVFVDGDGFSRVCQIPFSDSVSISLEGIGEHGKIVLIKSSSNGICCVDLITFSVLKHWPDYKEALCEDFLCVGVDQLLLLKDSTDIEKGGFLLTDLTHTWPQQQDTEDEIHEDALQSMLSAVTALDLRLQVSSKLLQSLEVQSHQKDMVLRKCRETLNTTLQMRNLHENQPDLMCLLGSPETVTAGVGSHTKAVDLGVAAQSLWRRVVGGKMVIGALVTNTGERPVTDIHMSLVCRSRSNHPQSLTAHGCMMYPSDSSSPDAHCTGENQHFQPGEKAWITTTIDCPVFDAASQFSYDVVLMWRDITGERQMVVQSCSLSVWDLDALSVDFKEEKILAGQVTRVDYLALDSIQQHTRLCVTCKHTAVSGISGLLCKDHGFFPITVDTADGFACDTGHLAGVRMYQKFVSLTSMNVEVKTWDRSQLVLFLRVFHSILPIDATVTPQGLTKAMKERSKSLTMKYLNNELDILKRAGKVNGSEDHQGVSKLVDYQLETDRAMIQLHKVK